MRTPWQTNLSALDQAAGHYLLDVEVQRTVETATPKKAGIDELVGGLRNLVDGLPSFTNNTTTEVNRDTIGAITVIAHNLVTHCVDLIVTTERAGIQDLLEAADFIKTHKPDQIDDFRRRKAERQQLARLANELLLGLGEDAEHESIRQRARTLAQEALASMPESPTPADLAEDWHAIRTAQAAMALRTHFRPVASNIDLEVTHIAGVLRDLQLITLATGGDTIQLDAPTLYQLQSGVSRLCRAATELDSANRIVESYPHESSLALNKTLTLYEQAQDFLGPNYYKTEPTYRLALAAAIFHILDGTVTPHSRDVIRVIIAEELSW